MALGLSELILNADGSIYHLNLFPKDISDTIILVGDQNRVAQVSKYFDSVELKKGKREFLTHTGLLNGKRLSVVSTGIGTDNIDIVLNELDALANVDFATRTVKNNRIRFKLVRVGTSGAVQPDIPIDSFVLGEYAIGFDGLLHFYKTEDLEVPGFSKAFMLHCDWASIKPDAYTIKCSMKLAEKLNGNRMRFGVTATNTGFYGPQGRSIRLALQDESLNQKITSFEFKGKRITNFEMESSAIYGLSRLLGHEAVSLNCILANRVTKEFSENPQKAIDELIRYTLQKLTQ